MQQQSESSFHESRAIEKPVSTPTQPQSHIRMEEAGDSAQPTTEESIYETDGDDHQGGMSTREEDALCQTANCNVNDDDDDGGLCNRNKVEMECDFEVNDEADVIDDSHYRHHNPDDVDDDDDDDRGRDEIRDGINEADVRLTLVDSCHGFAEKEANATAHTAIDDAGEAVVNGAGYKPDGAAGIIGDAVGTSVGAENTGAIGTCGGLNYSTEAENCASIVISAENDAASSGNDVAEEGSGGDTWESLFNDQGDRLDESQMNELVSAVGNVSVQKPQFDYTEYVPKVRTAKWGTFCLRFDVGFLLLCIGFFWLFLLFFFA